MNVLILTGSLRAASHNRQLAEAAIALLPAGTTVHHADLADLPHYSEEADVEGHVPEAARKLRLAIADADALIIATPEYNGSMSSALKAAIDWGSRPYGHGSLTGKPALVLGSSMSPYAAKWARGDAARALGIAGAKPIDDTVGLGSSHEVFTGADNAALPQATHEELAAGVASLLQAAKENSLIAA